MNYFKTILVLLAVLCIGLVDNSLWFGLLSVVFLYLAVFIKKTVIKRNINGKDESYLIRYTIITTPWFSIKLHKALLSDPEDCHDHPWDYWSFIIKGGYQEQTMHIRCRMMPGGIVRKQVVYVNRTYRPGCLLKRKAHGMHRLIIPEGKYSLSLILTFKKYRRWGFMKENHWTDGELGY